MGGKERDYFSDPRWERNTFLMWTLQDNRSRILSACDPTFQQQRTFLLAPECLEYLGGTFCYQ